MADRISDAVLDGFLRHDPSARVACETLLADQCVVVAGEFKTRSPKTFRAVRERAVTIVSDVLRDAGYRDSATGIDPERCEIQVRFNGQSADIHQGVDREDGVIGAGDQGLMFGYACDDTPELMPAPIVFAHRLVRRQSELRRSGALPWLGPDAKSQVSFRYEDVFANPSAGAALNKPMARAARHSGLLARHGCKYAGAGRTQQYGGIGLQAGDGIVSSAGDPRMPHFRWTPPPL